MSTDITPTIRQMKVEGSTTVAANIVEAANQVAFSPDGKTMAVAHGYAQDWTVRLWDVSKPGRSPQGPATLVGKDGPFSSIAFSSDGKQLAAGVSSSGVPSKIYIWDMFNLEAGTPTLMLNVPASTRAVKFSPNGKLLAAGVSDGIYLWEYPYKGKEPIVLSTLGENVNSIAFSSDNQRLAGTTRSGIVVYNITSPEQLDASPIMLPHTWVKEVAFSPDGYLLASTGGFQSDEGHKVKVWDLRQPVPTPIILPEDRVSSESVAFSPDGRWLASIGDKGNVLVWNVSKITQGSDKTSPLYELQGGVRVYSVVFSPDTKYLAGTGDDGEVLLWSMEDVEKNGTATPIVVKDDEQLAETSFTLTWNWNRFNEDFGEVVPPPAKTMKSP